MMMKAWVSPLSHQKTLSTHQNNNFMKKQPMTRSIFLAILIAAIVMNVLSSCKEDAFSPNQTEEMSIQSLANGAIYRIKIALPDNYNSSRESYGSVYVLDGEENFDLVAKTCKEISTDHSTPNVLVVSIGYGKDRSVDYTPTKVGADTGGGAEFLNFIRTQIIPQVEQHYRADTTRASRTILGHSYGGLFGACVFAVDNSLFGNYILLSPSIWFDNEVSLELEVQNRSTNKKNHQLVFLGIGEMENAGRMQAPFQTFYEILRDTYPDINVTMNREKYLDHMGSRDPNIIKGLNYYFQNR
jgi:predicted alpha/beta superfamily hydrolase